MWIDSEPRGHVAARWTLIRRPLEVRESSLVVANPHVRQGELGPRSSARLHTQFKLTHQLLEVRTPSLPS